ncbi:MAG TPA: hypothetical protein VK786_05485 [bacterium]|nr:hypothetical protein [bacterium]
MVALWTAQSAAWTSAAGPKAMQSKSEGAKIALFIEAENKVPGCIKVMVYTA